MSENVAKLVRSVLGAPHSELAMKRQVIELARNNLHEAGVTGALLESLPAVRDKETRDALLDLLMSLDTSRFERIDALHDAFIDVLKEEKERAARSAIISRLAGGLHQDERLAALLLGILAEPVLNEEERAAVTQAIATLPSISEPTAVAALERCVSAPAHLQAQALAIAERCPTWGEAVAKALAPYLDVRVDRALRLRLLNRMAQAKMLTPAHFPALRQTLRNDPDAEARGVALDLLRSIKPWGAELFEQLLWTGSKDGDQSLRARAVALQREAPGLSTEQLAHLASQLASDTCAGVRIEVLGALKSYVRLVEVRAAVARALASNPSAFEDAEFDALVDLLAPYATRDEGIRNDLLKSIEGLPRSAQRKRLIELILPKVKVDAVLPTLVALFSRERDDGLREVLFAQLKPLSVAKHPELVKIFCDELVEPGSPFRQECAPIVAAAAELYPEIPPALADVLVNDQDRELVRACLDGYLRPKVERKFEPLLAVVRNEVIDTGSRQRCLDEVMKLTLSDAQQQELTEALAGIKPNTLRTK